MGEPTPIERGFFRELDDGTTVFFPWGLAHRGYRLPDEAARKRAARGPSLLLGSVVAIGTWTAHALQPALAPEGTGVADGLRAAVAPGVLLLAVLAGYALWVARFVEPYPESDLQVSRDERLREAAEQVSPWKIALIGAVTGGLGVLVTCLEPRLWWLGGVALAAGAVLLYWSGVVRRAAARRSA